ncbi:hypothetical protein [Streptomyces sp. NPDC049881]|uniref:hypothetical protein n=1 Tax=Streptomyces sp. NPDC049881 TaxID=3155778 RepID=UPI003444A17C
MTDVFEEISACLPLMVDSAGQEQEILYVSGPGWRLRVSGAWRLVQGARILTSRDAEVSDRTAGGVTSLAGGRVTGVRPQGAFNGLDIALVLEDGRVLETFSDFLYDTWLLTLGELAVEGPLQR